MALLLVVAVAALLIKNAGLKKEISALKEKLNKSENDNYEYEASGIYDIESIETFAPGSETKHFKEDPEDKKKVYLTFDDGPSSNTDKILDILAEYNVKATFFVIGKDKESFEESYKRIADEGHTLGMHSYSHRYSEVYASKEAFKKDLLTLQEYIYDTTGVWSRFYRFPGGSSNTVSPTPVTELIEYLNSEGIVYFDWNIASGDAVEGTLSAGTITANCLSGIDKYDTCVILLHDARDRRTTVEALPMIIEGILKRGDCELLPITDETMPVQHVTAW